jgi:hypothetical protein
MQWKINASPNPGKRAGLLIADISVYQKERGQPSKDNANAGSERGRFPQVCLDSV